MSMHSNPESPIIIQSLTPQGSLHATEQHVHEETPLPYLYAEYATPDSPQHRPNPFITYWNKIGGGSFMISLLIHAGILIAAYFIVDVIVQDQNIDFTGGGGSKQSQIASQELATTVQIKTHSKLTKQAPPVQITTVDKDALVVVSSEPIEVIDALEPKSNHMDGAPASGGFSTKGALGGFGESFGIGGNKELMKMLPPSLIGRCGPAERLAKLKESGGSDQCERAVSDAIAYLKTKQNTDGSWGTGNKGAMTGFALLCYLGRCETPESVFYGDTVMKGILYLVELQKKNPNHMFSEATTGTAPVYEHGIATYALGEMYTLARLGKKTLPGMREAFVAGVNVIVDNQQEKGSWVYDQETGTYSSSREDLSVTGWQYQALKAARLTSLKIEGLDPAIKKVVAYLEAKQTKDGGIGETNRESHYNQWDLTGAGVLGLQTLAHGKSAAIKKGVSFAYALHQKEQPKWETAKLYNWYYYAQMFFQTGGPEWKMWNENALPAILKNQNKDGSWIHKSASQGGDNIYSTAMCTLMLEVYYRYLKVGDKEQDSIFSRS